MEELSNLVVYNDGELELKVSVDSETIWLTQAQMSELFDTSTDNISLHLKNIYKERELYENSTTENYSVVRQEGNRKVARLIKHYNLEAIICVGYRISSNKATKFRQWATSILKSYIQNGYVINTHKITEQRLLSLENDMKIVKSKIKDNKLEKDSGIFYDGQIYDSYSFINDLLKLSKNEIILIDNYIDDTIFTLFSKYQNINFAIYTSSISKQLKLDYEKYQTQYKNITLKTFKNSHDRFLILDKKEIYHLGASLKDLGKKWFAFSKMSLDIDDILSKLK
ncbi:virulence RhuM family protein [Aliarcobacter vitoriensis]|uniref:DNA-binding protein n=1 Tax=Aliarcobacter vitoriensis TaxID=2011099 RepID=A0A366MQQ5_9BACT|nr:RhuM family protein [Aliarcobacter vitoriensis]RBQ28163.1 DNA-binding protein [Aliarcobacter vitoriensis]